MTDDPQRAAAWRSVGLFATIGVGLGTWGLLAHVMGLARLSLALFFGAALCAVGLARAAVAVALAARGPRGVRRPVPVDGRAR